MSSEPAVHPLARELNERLAEAAREVLEMLSGLGRRLYFPRGIITQSAEAKARARRMNATIGIATEGGGPMYLPSIQAHLDLPPEEVYPYAPPDGRRGLREHWREKLLAENPSLRDRVFGLPLVTAAITHGLAVAGDLFVDPGDVILAPDMLWGNYRMTFEVRIGARIATHPSFREGRFDLEGFREALQREAASRAKLIALLNFPNNPTGYMPTEEEGRGIAEALVEQARAGTRIVALVDDAYFGLFYHLGGRSMTESLFGLLAGREPGLLAVKLDGATKELFVWGLRCGFLTFAPGRPETAGTVLEVLDAKARGAIRGGISNAPALSQSLVERALASPSAEEERKQKREILRVRAERVFEVVYRERYRPSFEPHPFNSGYFMCIRLKGADAEAVRRRLLDEHGVGVISIGSSDLRIAFSCLELEQIEPLFEAIHQVVQELGSEADASA